MPSCRQSFISLALRSGRIYPAIVVLRGLPASRNYRDACRLLSQADGIDRARLRVVLADLLSLRPGPTWILPVAVCYRSAGDGLVSLPELDCLDYLSGVISAQWRPIRMVNACSPNGHRGILKNRPQCVLLELRTSEMDAPEVSDRWIADVFSGPNGGATVEASLGPVLDYAEGIEAGYLLHALVSLKNQGIPITPTNFLQDRGWAATLELGLSFRTREMS